MFPFGFMPYRGPWNWGYPPFWDKQVELNFLKMQKEYLEFLLSQVNKRIKELENEKE